MSGLFAGNIAKTEAKALLNQGAYAKVQARSEALKYKQQGVEVMKNIARTQATINARAGAGGIDPFSGSAGDLSILAMTDGANELYNTMAGQTISLATGEAKATQFGLQAKAVLKRAQAETIGTLFEIGMMAASLYSAPAASGGTGLKAGQSATTSRAGFRGYGG
jgi:hypothetical protein